VTQKKRKKKKRKAENSQCCGWLGKSLEERGESK